MNARPNILIFILDHLTKQGISAYGMGSAKTPYIDSIAARGTMLADMHCNFPLCQPSRASFWSGRYPHQTRVQSNGRKHVDGPLPGSLTTLGETFKAAGYRTVHFGKTHDFGTLRGFDCSDSQGERVSDIAPNPAWPENIDTRRDNYAMDRALEWFAMEAVADGANRGVAGTVKADSADADAAAGRTGTAAPFLAVVDLNNPHNICGWIGENASLDIPEGKVRKSSGLVPIPGELPLLPDNFEVENWEALPLPIRYICCSHNRMAQASRWDELTYRHYIAAYNHYTEMADAQVGHILDALRHSGKEQNTIVMVFSDHGDGLTAHRMVTKQVSFYQEIVNIPFILAGPGILRRDQPLGGKPLSLLDLFPTLCGLAGLAVPDGLEGLDLSPALSGWGESDALVQREYVVAEWHTEWGFTVSPGRMVRSERYKYTHYLEGDGEELYDLVADPGERRNLAAAAKDGSDPAAATALADHRRMLADHVLRTGDDYFSLEVKVDPRWRSHQLGYPHHTGPSAPMLG